MNSQRRRWVCWKSKNTCWKSGLIRNTYTRYHIWVMRMVLVFCKMQLVCAHLLSIWYTCHSPVYHYITATAVYLRQRIITACVVVMWSQSLYLSRMNSQCGHYVCCKSTSTRWKSGLRWNTHGVDKHHVCLVFCIACICELPQDITMFMWTAIVNSLSQVADHPNTPFLSGRFSRVLLAI